MNFTNQIDDELCKSIIENRNLLLSSTPQDQAINNGRTSNNDQMGIDFFSMLDSQSEMSLVDLNQPSIFDNNNNSQPQTPDNTDNRTFTNEQLGFNDEIIDSDLFEFLRSEDPEVMSLLESLNNSDLIQPQKQPVYLPQISINTTNQVLDDVNNSSTQADPQLSIFNLTNDHLKQEVLSPPSQPEVIQPEVPAASRVSLRLIKRRNNHNSSNANLFTDLVRPKKEPKRLKKRNRSIDDRTDVDEGGSLFSNSNENSSDNNSTYNSKSMGYESDEHIYFEDDDFSPSACQLLEENSNEREFQEFVLNYNEQRNVNGLGDGLDVIELDGTVKKDANKEAATRYRLKKLSEKDRMFEMRMGLEKENDEIKRRCELVVTEINYLKSLLVQMLLTKGVMSDKLGV